MWYIVFSVIFLGVITAVIGYMNNRKQRRMLEQGEIEPIEAPKIIDENCCGQHEVCERDSLHGAVSKEVEYYDDDELDVYRGISSDTYSEDIVDEFREIFHTLREIEVAGWIRSLQLRGIHLPDALKDEAFLILGERRID